MLDCLDDVYSDLSVFHRIKDAGKLDSEVFFKLAWRLTNYEGSVQNAVRSAMSEATVEQQQETAAPVATLEELARVPSAPTVGQEVPMFEVVKAT